MLGWIIFYCSPTYAHRLRKNLVGAGLNRAGQKYYATEINAILRANIAEMGKSASELPWVWCRPLHEVLHSVQACPGLEHVEAARARGQGVIILTPHLGCFEITAQYYAYRAPAGPPLTVLYRPPKKKALEPLLLAGRARPNLRVAGADLRGVRVLLRALRHGEAIGILPDQAPGVGEGEWAEFFGRPAYTMTLAGRLAGTSGAQLILACAERLPQGRGYHLQLSAMPQPLPGESPARTLNRALEGLIRLCPAQYVWGYNRYKVPAGAQAPKSC